MPLFANREQPLDPEDLARLVKDVSTCPHPDKLRWDSEQDAQERAFPLGLETYLCVCGKYHMTSCFEGYEPPCPVCGAPLNEYESCGCYEDLMYGDGRDWL